MRDVSEIKDCSGMIKHTFGGGKVGLRIESGKVGGRTCQLELSDLNMILLSDTI